MEVNYKQSRREEFAALMQTLENQKVKAAEVAQYLGVTAGAISQFRSGRSTPKEGNLINLRRMVEERVNPPRKHESGPNELHDRLLDLERHDPAAFDVARVTIEALHNRIEKSILHAKPADRASRPKTDAGKTGNAVDPAWETLEDSLMQEVAPPKADKSTDTSK